LDTSDDFTVIIEDDVAFHTNDFVSVVQELAQNWDNVRNHGANGVFLGWMPMKNVSEYKNIEKKLSLESSPDLEFMHMIPVGVQAYMIEKECAKVLSPLLNQSTHEAVVKSIKAHKFRNINDNHSFYVADHYIPHILIPLVAFPPLGIELPLPSTIGHSDQQEYWDRFFKGHESLKKFFWFYNAA
jgi:GR25 family glycosyltransferase involved in LPS biosynthesis